MRNGQLQYLNPWQKLLLFFASFYLALFLAQLGNMLMAQFLLQTDNPAEVVSDLTKADGIRMMKISNLIVHFIAFILPTIILAKLIDYDPKETLLFKTPKKQFWIFLPIVFICLTNLNDILSSINHQLNFSFLSTETQKTLELQQAIQEKTIYAYVGNTWKSYFFNILLIGLVPAISEELIFRGLLQNLISKAANNVWIGITISAFLFALMHRMPFNFFPILALGFVYGVIAAYTGSIMITMALHFLNNALSLTLMHLQRVYNWENITLDIYIQMTFIVVSGVLVFWFYKKQSNLSQWHATKGIYLR
ncbi:MAG: CPBP family intramembrane metalloprotease [Flavobacteriales bacterium]|nr:CPBP family intramembrane metalloprotease [Flavobacteriales bacterium]